MADQEKKKEGRQLLIVEDDKFLRDLLVHRMEREGIPFEAVPDGETALARMKEEPPNLIMLDIILPGIDGYTVLQKIKGDANLASVRVIMLSNLGQSDEKRRAVELGAEEFLVKANLDLDDIVKKIRSILNEKVERKE